MTTVTSQSRVVVDVTARTAVVVPAGQGQVGVVVRGPQGPPGSSSDQVTEFFKNGEMNLVEGYFRIYNLSTVTRTLIDLGIALVEGPAGVPLIGDLLMDGTSVFTDESKRPQIEPDEFYGLSGPIDTTAWHPGSYLTFQCVQVGEMPVPGEDLTGEIHWRIDPTP